MNRERVAACAAATAAVLGIGVVPSAAAQEHGGVVGNAESCVSGTLRYSYADAEAADGAPSHSVPVTQAKVRNANWKLVAEGTHETLAEGVTGASDGGFNACFDAGDSGKKVALVFESAHRGLWRVVNKNSEGARTYGDKHPLGLVNDDKDLGTIEVGRSTAAAFKIVDTMTDVWAQHGDSGCWTSHEQPGNCTPITFVWNETLPPDEGYWDWDGPERGTRFVVVGSESVNSKHVIAHEAAHAFTWLLHDKSFPKVTDCNPHYFDTVSSPSCAWTEGFADSIGARSLGDTSYVYGDGQVVELVGPHPDWDAGEATQGRVDGALLELWSGPDASQWQHVIDLMTNAPTPLAGFREFWEARPRHGLSVDGDAKAIIERNTIHY